MRFRIVAAALGFLALFAVPVPASAHHDKTAPSAGIAADIQVRADDGDPSAAALLAKTENCNVVSNGTYTNTTTGGQVSICGANGAFFWTSGMNIDCDGQRTDECNENTDCCFQPDTTYHQTDGQPLDAARLPYYVIPLASSIWDFSAAGIRGGDIAAIVYNGHVEYAVFGDTGPAGIIGEASYASAAALGINPDPSSGGTSAPVTYIVFPGSAASPIEDHGAAVGAGRTFAQQFIDNN